MDWTKYRETFPKRYFKESYFDGYVRGLIDTIRPGRILEIGCGTVISVAPKPGQHAPIIYTLDPNVPIPGWSISHINWDTTVTFPFIVARGVLNYLTKEEMLKIISFLQPGGIFLANTFNRPPYCGKKRREITLKREYVDETMEYKQKEEKIVHKLFSAEDGKLIEEHEFNYYHISDYLKVFGERMFPYFYGDNSLMIKYMRGE